MSLRLLIRQGVFYEGIIPGCSNYQYCKRMPAAQTAGEWELAWVCAMCEFMGPDRKQRNSEAGTIRLRTLDKLAAKTRQHYYVIPLLVFLSSSSCSARFCSVFTVLPIFQRLRDHKKLFLYSRLHSRFLLKLIPARTVCLPLFVSLCILATRYGKCRMRRRLHWDALWRYVFIFIPRPAQCLLLPEGVKQIKSLFSAAFTDKHEEIFWQLEKWYFLPSYLEVNGKPFLS